ncbi:DUF2834 domain-containing protein [Kordiimonas aquimaris]|uniref:DUF2834 domain-containing protein n=1 Tax=Kordiimonas aquimaris TaxID=707591 RepID=UPI0021D0A9DB|nr:DUF2834 domain-containing protein [Kordiimonas aquimaris]
MNTKFFYIVMAVVGMVVPWYFFGSFIAENGLYAGDFVAAAMINGAAAGGVMDLVISSVIFWVWSYTDAQQKGVVGWWVLIPLNLFIGLSLALPLYLIMRHNTMKASASVTA